MPANIAVIDGKAAVVLAREPAWHGLGTVVDHQMKAEEAFRLAHLDWTVARLLQRPRRLMKGSIPYRIRRVAGTHFEYANRRLAGLLEGLANGRRGSPQLCNDCVSLGPNSVGGPRHTDSSHGMSSRRVPNWRCNA
jgi:hypothetical protein